MGRWLQGVFLAGSCACATTSNARPQPPPEPPPAAAPALLEAMSFPLPGATPGHVSVDYLAWDPRNARVWIPVAETGSADAFDVATGTFARAVGFRHAEREVRGKTRTMGPSAAAVGDGFVYVGNRATGEVCAVDERTLAVGACLLLPTPPDGVAYAASSKEVWVTTPRDLSITVLDASNPPALKPKLVIKTDGDPEGYAVDSTRGLFYTNLEDKNRTLAIDIATHALRATWSPGCGADGPRGIAVDQARNFVLVACTDGVRVLDGSHDGAPLGRLDTGAGVDNIEYREDARLLFAAAGKASRLTVARLSDKGEPSVVATAVTAEGASNAVADAKGHVYVVDPGRARLLRFAFSAP